MEGIWDSAKANMEMYLLLAEKARAFRADPEVQELMEAASIFELAEPTLAAGESVADFLASDEPFDPDAKGEREYHYVALQQAAMRHLVG